MPSQNVDAPTGLFLPGSDIPRRPSDVWFNSSQLGWIDGASNPPILFYTTEDQIAALQYYRPDDPRIPLLKDQQAPTMYRTNYGTPELVTRVTPTPTPTVPPPPPVDPAAEQRPPNAYRVTVTMRWTGVEETRAATAKPAAPKKLSENKSTDIDLNNINRGEFLFQCMRVQGQHEKYRIGTMGPGFKFWWSGCGPKGNAISVETDEEFDSAVKNILSKKKTPSFQVVADFDVDQWHPFRIRKRTLDDASDDVQEDEMIHGTKVPRVGDFTEDEQVNGRFIRILEKKWVCVAHPSENNGPGYCYVDAGGTHWGLCMRKKRFWGAAMAAGEASAKEPPNSMELDGARDGQVMARPRGRNGPHQLNYPPPPPPANNDLSLLTAALLAKIIGDLPSATGTASTTPAPAPGPVATPSTPTKSRVLPIVFSPVPPSSSELHVCLEDFHVKEGVNLLASESKLVELRFRPAIIPRVSLDRLMEVTGAVEGDALLFQSFCECWCARLDEKKRSLAASM